MVSWRTLKSDLLSLTRSRKLRRVMRISKVLNVGWDERKCNTPTFVAQVKNFT
jgi:hypothetical protein